MKRFLDTPISLDQFPVPWSGILSSTIGDGTFVVRQTSTSSLAPSEWLGIVSSHESKNGFAHQDWQDSLHSALQLSQKQGWGIMVASESPYAEVVVHMCKRLHVPFRTLRISNAQNKAGSHAKSKSNTSPDACDCGVIELAVQRLPGDSGIPMHDCATVFLANRLFVVALRPGGKIAQLMESRLSHEAIPVGTTYLSLANSRSSPGAIRQAIYWLDRGAIGWLNAKQTQPFSSQETSSTSRFRCRTSETYDQCLVYQPIIPTQLLGATASKYLVHCTRARRGPWPDQSLTQFHDELLQNPWDEQPTAMMTLQRILKQQRLLATNSFRRGNQDTVCFASKELVELLAMRRFQSHLARWDWEPYGIMIDRKWLQSHGAKQVCYIDRPTAKQTSVDELTFCQVVSSEEGALDWRQEQEWRIAGDVRLNQIPFSKAIVFVPTLAEAIAIQSISRWPIAVCAKEMPKPGRVSQV